MASRFRTIDYPRMLLETLRAYYSVNSDGIVNDFYRYLACIIQPLIPVFARYQSARIINAIIANCYWQIGQVTNVLNYLYDNVENRIFITQSYLNPVSASTFNVAALVNAGEFGSNPVQLRTFNDKGDQTPVIINIPNTVNLAQITATINQLILQGIIYEINVFTPPIS